MCRILWFFISLTLAVPTVAAAQPDHPLDLPRPYDGPALSLADAVSAALAQNLDIVALRRHLDALRLRPGQERSLPPPMLGAQIWQWPVNTLNPWKTNFYMPMITQELPGRGKRQLRATLAEKDVELGNTDLAMREREVTNLVKQAYVDLFLARKAVDIHLASVGVLRQIADMSQAKYAGGGGSQQDVLKGVLEISKLHDDLLMLDEQAQLSAARLNTLMNRPIDAAIGPMEDPREQGLVVPIEQLQAAALANKPELTAARQQVERTNAELAVAKQDDKPDFSVQAGYMLMPHQTDGVMLQGAISWPNAPWSRRKIALHLQEIAAQIDAEKARQRALENEVRLEVDTAYVRARTAEQRASLLRTTILPQSRQTLEVARVAYQTSASDVLSILDNERMLLGSELDYFKALGEFQQALGDLEHAVGIDITPAMLSPVVSAEAKP